MVHLSVNINKIALLRNARGGDRPNLMTFASLALDAGAAGITIHPRPDQRHITADDARRLSVFMKDKPHEFNIEGNPFEGVIGSFPGFALLKTHCRISVHWYRILYIKKHRIMVGILKKSQFD